MYEDLLQSSARPFRATPDEKFYFPYESIETARTTAVRAVRRAEGPVMVLGGVGLGKSLVGDLIASELKSDFDLVRLRAARLCSRRALLQNILFDLQMPYKDLSEGELRISIMNRLQPQPEFAPEGILVVVDEAHTLPIKLLEELRLITNFTRQGQPRVCLVLIGGMQLEDTFAGPQLESFNQRLAARCYLTPMSREQTRQYVEHQVSIAGYTTANFITDDGLQAVYAASEGVPRLVNQVMDHALVLALASDKFPIQSQLIEEAWADLQQLPAPWQTVADMQSQTATSEVEFGALDENDSDFSSFDIPHVPTDFELGAATPEANNLTLTDDADWPPTRSDDTTSTGNPSTEPDQSADNFDPQNFFAAFEESEQMKSLEEPVRSKADDEDATTLDQLEKPEVVIVDVFKAFASGRHSVGHEHVESNQTLPVDSFFHNRPTDEKLLALEDEQQQYDMMGVWENDPPLATDGSSAEPATAANIPAMAAETAEYEKDSQQSASHADNSGDDANSAPSQIVAVDLSPATLFGEDFEEEIAIGQEAAPSFFDPESESTDELLRSWNSGQTSSPDSARGATSAFPTRAPEVAAAGPLARNDQANNPNAAVGQAAHGTADVEGAQLAKSADDCPAACDPISLDVVDVESGLEFDNILVGEVEPSNSPQVVPPAAAINVDVREIQFESSISDESSTQSPVDSSGRSVGKAADDRANKSQDTPSDLAASIDESVSVDSILQDIEQGQADFPCATSDFAEAVIPWSLDVGAVDEAAVEREIEDLVSQLNFSAFSVEPYSVEQISLKVQHADSEQTDDIALDESRYDKPGVATDQTASIFGQGASLYDDDRDLLVIEEDVQTAVPANSSDKEQPQTKPAPYAQLFAKLRR